MAFRDGADACQHCTLGPKKSILRWVLAGSLRYIIERHLSCTVCRWIALREYADSVCLNALWAYSSIRGRFIMLQFAMRCWLPLIIYWYVKKGVALYRASEKPFTSTLHNSLCQSRTWCLQKLRYSVIKTSKSNIHVLKEVITSTLKSQRKIRTCMEIWRKEILKERSQAYQS